MCYIKYFVYDIKSLFREKGGVFFIRETNFIIGQLHTESVYLNTNGT